MRYGQDVMSHKFLYGMVLFCKIYRQLAGALWLSLYCMKCKRHVIALLYHYALAIVGNSWQDDHDAMMEIKVSSR